MKKTLLTIAIISQMALSSTPPLESQLEQLKIPENQAPGVSMDRLYAVQARYSPLRFRHEITIGGAQNFADTYLRSYNIDLSYRFHFSDRWAVGLNGSYVFNSLSSASRRLLETEHILPDVAYTKNRADLMVYFNTFYGKFRLSLDQVFYFDQYFAVGPGTVELHTGWVPAAVGEVGLAFWLGKWGVLRAGVKDYFHFERRLKSEGTVHDLLAHAQFGVLLGGNP